MNLKNKSILVTGGAGFLGSHLCKELLLQRAKVICFDDLSQGSRSKISALEQNNNFLFIKGDCNKLISLEKVFKNHKIDYVFHYAATVGVKRTLENPLAVLEDIEGIKNIFHLSRIYKVKKVIFASSSEVYGEPTELPEREDGPLNSKLPYAQVKLIGESYCKVYWEEYRVPTTAFRFFNIFGPQQESSDYGFVVGIFMSQVASGQSPTVVSDGKMTRDFVYVKDNINATIQALGKPQTNGEVINIGTGMPITILDLANKIIKISGNKVKPKFIPPRNAFEILHREPETAKMSQLLDYKFKYSLESALKETYEFYKK